MAVINGTDLILKVNNVAVAHATTASLTMDANMIDVSSKDSGGDSDFLPGIKSATIDFEGLTDFSVNAGYGLDTLVDLFDTRASVVWSLQQSTSGFSGSGYISSLSVDGPMEDVSTFSGTIQVTGSITYA